MLCKEAVCNELCSVLNHHSQDFFAVFVDGGDLVEIDYTDPIRRLFARGLPGGDQLREAVFDQPFVRPFGCGPLGFRSVRDTLSAGPRERITARSMTF